MSTAIPGEQLADEAVAWLVRLGAEEVDESTRAAFFAWLGESEAHQQAYVEAEKLWADLEVLEKLPSSALDPRSSWLDWLRNPVAGFATLLIVGVALFMSLQWPGSQGDYYVTAIGQRAEFTLADGSRLHLNTDSEVSVTMEDSRRMLQLLRGEAYFDVAHDPARPLVVQTDGGLVRVLGTRFNIRRYNGGSTVTVEEGVVAVVPGSQLERVFEPMFEAEITLTAAQQATLQDNTPIAAPVTVESLSALAWREGRLVYDGVPLARVIADIDRYFPGTIKLADDSLAEVEVVGMLNLQNRSATLEALEATFNVQVVRVSEQLTLVKRRPE